MRPWRRTTLLTCACVAFLSGIGVSRWIAPHPLVASAGLLCLIKGWRRRSFVLACGIICLGLCTGLWRGQVYGVYASRYDAVVGQTVGIIGVAQTDAVYEDQGQIAFDVSRIVRLEGGEALPGRMVIKGHGVPMVYKGDTVTAKGKVYRTRGSRQAGMSFAQIQVAQSGRAVIDRGRRHFEAYLHSVLPEPAGSFGLGLLTGQRSGLPSDVNDQLSKVGLTHIVAVSGYNLTIIMRLVRRLLRNGSKYQTTVISLLLMGSFLLVTGFSASIVRAALVSGLSLWAWYYGRAVPALLLLTAVGALTAGVHPYYVWADIGWYLSFLAFFGVLSLGPLLTRRLYRAREPKIIAATLIETMAAQVMTEPFILFIFGRLAVVSLLANLLVVPLTPLAMASTFVAGVGHWLDPVNGGWWALPAQMILTYMLDIVALLARLPFAQVAVGISAPVMAFLYVLIVVVMLILWHANRGRYGIIPSKRGDSNT